MIGKRFPQHSRWHTPLLPSKIVTVINLMNTMWQARTTIHPTQTTSGINDHEGPVLTEKPIAAQLTKNLLPFTEPENSLPYSTQLAIGSYPELH